MGSGDWIGIAALGMSLVLGLCGYLRRPALIPAGKFDDLRIELDQMRIENTRLTARVAFLESRVETLMSEAHWWQEQYRDLKIESGSKK